MTRDCEDSGGVLRDEEIEEYLVDRRSSAGMGAFCFLVLHGPRKK
jgi:hypothetical protein